MKETIFQRFTMLFLLCLSWSFFSLAAEEDEGKKATDKVQIADSGDQGIQPGTVVTVSFPSAMVQAAEIDSEAKKSPIRFEPPVTGKFIWKSQTEGEFTAAEVTPGTTFKIFLEPGLADLDGKPVKQKKALGERSSAAFAVDSSFSADKLDKRPSVPLHFSHDVKPSDLLDTVWFQDRDSRQRVPIEVVLEENTKEAVSEVTVTPREDLPGGRTFDLVIDGLKEAGTGSRLDKVQVIPLGETEALRVVKVAGFNYPMQRRRIAVEFSEAVDPAEGHKIKIDPPVQNLEVKAEGEALWIEGDFDIAQRYSVTIPAGVVGKRGFATVAESRWGVSFHAKKPALIFPGEDVHERAKAGLRFTFMQVNTGPLEWRLGRVPPEKLLAVNSRLREFTVEQTNPVTSETDVDPATGFPKWTKTELLIDACRLEIVADGKIDAA
ncbi:MAG: hypothetical protein WCD79_19475, partial [Chthoniobacteraceae bacterium]